MDNTDKLTNSKQVIAYIAERFPSCFSLEGEAKPLKIGIFQDLAERLSADEKVSKTQLRAALRLYTSSWRYLYSVKENAVRVDLDGGECGIVDAEHVEHAKATLAESKAKVAERRKEKALEKNKKSSTSATENISKQIKSTIKQRKPRSSVQKNTKLSDSSVKKSAALKLEDIIVGKNVNVNMGTKDMPATIVEINKDDVRIRLANGLTMLVKAEHLRP